jgi:hypothetical protein
MNLIEKKVTASLLLEVIGRPAEYLTETLNNLIKDIEKEKGVKLKDKRINPPILVKEQKDFYSSFAEIEVEVEEIAYLVSLIFKYMPAHVEIISPQNISLSNSGWADILSELTRRLHGYEEVVRIIDNEKTILENKLKGILKIENKKEKDKE